jgi:DNA-binding response OmpR family regulator
MKELGAILIVSHDPQQADVRKHRLEDAGYKVISAMNIHKVREACQTRSVELAVIGYSLPPAEKRRAWLEVRQACGGQVPILELRNHESATIADSTVIIHHPEKHSSLAERVRQILEM